MADKNVHQEESGYGNGNSGGAPEDNGWKDDAHRDSENLGKCDNVEHNRPKATKTVENHEDKSKSNGSVGNEFETSNGMLKHKNRDVDSDRADSETTVVTLKRKTWATNADANTDRNAHAN